MLQGQLVEDVDDAVGVDRAVGVDGQGFAGELVDDVEHLDGAPVGGGVELKVHRPDHVRTDRTHRPNGGPDAGQAFLLAALRDPQALLAPEAADALVVDGPAGFPGCDRCSPPAPAGPVGGEFPQPGPQLGFLIGDRRRLQAHRGAVQADHGAGSTL